MLKSPGWHRLGDWWLRHSLEVVGSYTWVMMASNMLHALITYFWLVNESKWLCAPAVTSKWELAFKLRNCPYAVLLITNFNLFIFSYPKRGLISLIILIIFINYLYSIGKKNQNVRPRPKRVVDTIQTQIFIKVINCTYLSTQRAFVIIEST